MKAVGDGELLEVEPEALNGIEKRAVLGQPDEQETVAPMAERRLNSFAAMIGGVVQNKNELEARMQTQQPVEESDESIAVLVLGGAVGNLPVAPVVGAEDMEVLGRTGSGNELAFAALGPATPQRRMEAYGRFVHKEKLGFCEWVEGDGFFSHSSTVCIIAWASWS